MTANRDLGAGYALGVLSILWQLAEADAIDIDQWYRHHGYERCVRCGAWTDNYVSSFLVDVPHCEHHS